MNPEYVLKWVVGVSSLFELVAPWLGFPGRAPSWRWLAGAMLLLLIAASALDWQEWVWGVGAVWGIFVALASLADRRRADLLRDNHLQSAALWARIAAILHPFNGSLASARLLQARALAESGNLPVARAWLQRLERDANVGELARLEGLRLDARWSALLSRLEQRSIDTLELRCLALEAYGETGDGVKMLGTFARLPTGWEAPPLIDLRVAAYTGRVALVERLLQRTEPFVSQPMAQYYRSIALQVSGNPVSARPLLQAAETHDAYERRALARLRRPLEPLDTARLPAKARHTLAAFNRQMADELDVTPTPRKRPLLTWCLATVLVANFFIAAPSGAVNTEKLLTMGALMLPAHSNELWRLVTAGFAHYGLTHLGLNLLLLLLFGAAMERLWGRLALVGCFSCASIGSYFIASLTSSANAQHPEMLLGASAGIFGVLGGLLAFDAVGYAIDRAPLLKRRLLMLTLLVVAQFVFDSFTPIVRSSLHLSGVLLGALVAAPLALRVWWPHRTFA